MKEVVDKVSKRWIHVEVTEPVTITTKKHLGLTNSYTSYLIRIENNHWAFTLNHSEVRRRFSEFCWLRSKLQVHHPNKIVPPLPPKHLLHVTNFDPILIEERANGLEKFIQRVLRSFVFLSDAALHLFLQSNLTIEEIEGKLTQEIQPKVHYTTVKRPSSSSINITTKNKQHNVEFNEFNGSCSSGGSITSSELDVDVDDDCDTNDSESCVAAGSSFSSESELDKDMQDDDDGIDVILFYGAVAKTTGHSTTCTTSSLTTSLRKIAIGNAYEELSK